MGEEGGETVGGRKEAPTYTIGKSAGQVKEIKT